MKFPHIFSRHRWLRGVLRVAGAVAALWLVGLALVPARLFDDPYSAVLYSADGQLLGARVAADGQWRIPASDSLPEKFAACLVKYEDKNFYRHPGIDPLAIGRAIRDNIRARHVVSGGSTITMQLARIARGNRSRNLWQKSVESFWAVHIETTHSKSRILELYASHAPFGGNVVGLESAAWRYFGRSPHDLSWAESATLAVLPNSPALIHPGRNRNALKTKRDRLLKQLHDDGTLDAVEYELACFEPLPDAPVALPDAAPHLLERIAREGGARRVTTTLDARLQRRVQQTVDHYARLYASANHVHNLAAVVADVETGEVVAYAGNVSFEADERHGNSVDIITAPRSTGSVLKPLLYAAMLQDGMLLPSTLVADTPLNINGFAPENYNRTFHGAVPAHSAVERSLNVPLVRMLSQYNTGRFMALLKACGMTTLRFSEDHYGASLILGGAEGTLWDIAGIYASLARTLGHFQTYNGRYNPADIHPLTVYPAERAAPIVSPADRRLTDRPVLSAASIWLTFEAMSRLGRPEEEADWQQFASMKRVAWKTGTSYGGRDAWSVGVTPRWVVGVWVGNASGEGRAGLAGVGNAAPVMFDIFSMLAGGGWFAQPLDEMERAAVCRLSGHRASEICSPVDTLWIPRAGIETAVCPYHRLVHLSADGRWRVNSSCEPVDRIVSRAWFVLPPAQEYYYRNHHIDYAPLPPLRAGCEGDGGRRIDVIYPEHGAVLFLPRGMGGQRERFVFKAAHTRRDETVYWYVDDRYVGQTRSAHQISCDVSPGAHILTLTDSQGSQRRISFTVTE
jgi:penicillin-binding protein 1C